MLSWNGCNRCMMPLTMHTLNSCQQRLQPCLNVYYCLGTFINVLAAELLYALVILCAPRLQMASF